MAAAWPISLCIFAVALLINAAAAATYTNYTVGGDAGWFFNSTTNKPSANYDAWAANKTFNLGDYLSKFDLIMLIFVLFLPTKF